MTVFVTGATGYLGSYAIDRLLSEPGARLALLVRASDRRRAEEKLWKAWQLHMDGERFYEALDRIELVYGDLTSPKLGVDDDTYRRLTRTIESVLHIAASLNRKSERACLNTNLRGTLSVVKLARAAADHHGLRRFSHVSAVAVGAGGRAHEVVAEDESVDWNARDFDPYARTKKFCEHMVDELLPDVSRLCFRPPTVLGDSRFPETTQFDMVRALCVLADMPVVPFDGGTRFDVVNADFVGECMAALHTKDRPQHDVYHLTSGTASETLGEIADAIFAGGAGRAPRFAPRFRSPFERLVDGLAGSRRRNPATYVGSLLKVFLPYIANDVVYDNRRVTAELGIEPVPFSQYCGPLYRWAKQVRFDYPYQPLPARPTRVQVPPDTEHASA